ncbi:MAG TPA: beta-glucosidase, partial [Ruminococcaceae bacterium]|nr:beta-glucosidase [Oscillospiraceae bacterium]
MGFKKDFVWGAASASYQVEGAAYDDGKGLSIWDEFCKQPDKIKDGCSGDIACDHYRRYKEDVKLMKQLGIKAYRFSTSWPRIIPEGCGKINEAGLDFYDRLVNELLENDIEPYVTLYHWDLPINLHYKGGWLNRDIADWFARYAAVVTERLSDRVKSFITFNEPQCFIGLGYCEGRHAPGLRCSGRDTFAMAHNAMLAHGKAVIAMRAVAKRNISIGYVSTGSMNYPLTNSAADIEAARKATFRLENSETRWTWNLPWFNDPVYLGEYPADGLKMYERFLPQIAQDDMKIISQPLEYIGLNIYNGKQVKADANGGWELVERYDGFPKTALGWPVTPQSLYWGPKFIYERYSKPIFITENGLSCHDVISIDGKVHDPNRIDFLNRYLLELRNAADDGIDIAGYFQWSFTDNFEWHSGYGDRFGLV